MELFIGVIVVLISTAAICLCCKLHYIQNVRKIASAKEVDAITVLVTVRELMKNRECEEYISKKDSCRIGAIETEGKFTISCGGYSLEVTDGEDVNSIWDKVDKILFDYLSYMRELGPINEKNAPIFSEYLNGLKETYPEVEKSEG